MILLTFNASRPGRKVMTPLIRPSLPKTGEPNSDSLSSSIVPKDNHLTLLSVFNMLSVVSRSIFLQPYSSAKVLPIFTW